MSSELYIDKVLRQRAENPEENSGPELYWKSITAAQRRMAPTHCGPNGSYPLGPGCNHVSAAFKLGSTGHGQPNMSCIRNYARSHGCGVPQSQKAKDQYTLSDPNEWLLGEMTRERGIDDRVSF